MNSSLSINKNKKSQFFIFAAIIIISLTLMLFSDTFIPKAKRDNFKEMSDNYASEAPYAINSAITQNKDPVVSLDDFTKKFIEYAKYQNVDFKVLYIIKAKDFLTVSNRLSEDVIFYNQQFPVGRTVAINTYLNQNATNDAVINYKQKNYSFTFSGIEDYQSKFIIVKR